MDPERIHSAEWPKIIAYSFKNKEFLIIEGKGYGYQGVALPELRALEKIWNDLFIALDAEWFLKIIEAKNNLVENELIALIQKNRVFGNHHFITQGQS